MTTERATPPAEHGAAMLYAAIAAADARHAELRADIAELRRDTARSIADLRKDNARLREDVKRDIEIAQWKTIAGVSLALFAASGVIVAGVKFVLEWPFG